MSLQLHLLPATIPASLPQSEPAITASANLHLQHPQTYNYIISKLTATVAGSPKVHDRDCLIRLHTMTALLDFTRCSPSCSSYIRRTFVRLSCTYNQLTHSLQQVMSPAVATD
jgi:hypothetical protein